MTHTEVTFLSKAPGRSLFELTNPYVVNKLDVITSPQYKLQSYTGYCLLGKIMSEVYCLDLNKLKIGENERGKPYFVDVEINFSISHSNDAVLCTVSKSCIGADIEKIGNIREKILKSFSPLEQEQVKSPKDFYTLWTLKESFAKLTGNGLSDVRNAEFELKPRITCTTSDIKGLYFKSFEIYDYVISISTTDTIADPIIIV